MSFTTKYAVPGRIEHRILELSIRRRQSNYSIVFTVCSCEEKDCYSVISGQLGLTAARTAGTATVGIKYHFSQCFFYFSVGR